MQQAWTVTAFRETRGASRRFRSAERGNATSPGLLIERVGSVAPAQLSVKARPVKSALPALRSREGTRAPARLRSGLRHRSAVARERLALAQGVAARLSGRRRRPFAMPRGRSVTAANPFGDTGAVVQPGAGAPGTYEINDDCAGSVHFLDANNVTFKTSNQKSVALAMSFIRS
jgi:hypothetical protein